MHNNNLETSTPVANVDIGEVFSAFGGCGGSVGEIDGLFFGGGGGGNRTAEALP